ncbi:prolyl-tRNA synthetase associated domain-containing protein [Roseococcus sp. SYP-B2431]|uniref:prolyl-tRNA synthetase associated domain-containing protein n=1 Tax=Roseococcus sp. SYP-B2431 TaxID=2496640 RepID=UPI0010396D8C|nr:prolyl-tRNA synthetase associated domain-containing protein [Roseococcus sp. SYP-B2431]TCH98957.1 prolyl-tRNA synthetase associated domain-containing protein [Roseococcus sp. SYP-B2431]
MRSHPEAPVETPEGLLARLAAAGIEVRNVGHKAVFTVAEAESVRGGMPGAHSKNLFLAPAKGDGPYALAVLEAERKVSVNALARAAGWGKVTMGSAEALAATLGVTPGSVTPFGLVNAPPGSVRVALDAALAEAPGLAWFHPLVNTASTGIRPADLLRFLEGLGHEVAILKLEP